MANQYKSYSEDHGNASAEVIWTLSQLRRQGKSLPDEAEVLHGVLFFCRSPMLQIQGSGFKV